MKIILCSNDEKFSKKIKENFSENDYIFIKDINLFNIPESDALMIDMESFTNKDIIDNMVKFAYYTDILVICVRPIKYTPYDLVGRISTNIIVAEGIPELKEFFESNRGLFDSIKFGDWEMKISDMTLYHNGAFVKKLFKKEFYILQLFASNQNELIPRDKLMGTSWNGNTFRNRRSFDVYMVGLKHIFECDPKIKFEMVYGKGFIMRVEN